MGVIRYFQADLNIAMLPGPAYRLFLKVMHALDTGVMTGLKEGLKKEARQMRRHHYKNTSSLPIAFYKKTFAALLDDQSKENTEMLIAKVSNPRADAPHWQATSTNMWFQNLRSYADWEASFHAYRRFTAVLENLLQSEERRREWRERCSSIVDWNWWVEESAEAFESVNCRLLCQALEPSSKDALKKKAIDAKVLDFPTADRDDAAKVYSDLTAGDLESQGWIHQFIHPKKAFVSKKSSTALAAKASFDKVIDEWSRIYSPQEHLSLGVEEPSSDKVHHVFGVVVKRKPQVHNLVYSGAGTGLHLNTDDERLFVSPFLEVAKAWLARQPYLLHSQAQYVNYLQDALMDPLLRLGYTVCTVS